MVQIHHEYHSILVRLDKQNNRMRSNYKPWPNPTVALMCTYGWVRRTEPNGDFIEMTETGRKMLTAEVSR